MRVNTQLNIGQETLRGLLANWLTRRRAKAAGVTAIPNGDASPIPDSGPGEHGPSRRSALDDNLHEPNNQQTRVFPSFQFSTQAPPSIITEGSQVKPFSFSICGSSLDFWSKHATFTSLQLLKDR